MRKRGFTLIEILVVISIISVLIVFLAPRLLNFKDRGSEVAVKAVMHSVQLAVESYNMENLTYPVATDIGVRSLVLNYLEAGNYISGVPQNPFTGKEYQDDDVPGRIVYYFDESEGKYTIVGYKRNGTSKLLELSNM